MAQKPVIQKAALLYYTTQGNRVHRRRSLMVPYLNMIEAHILISILRLQSHNSYRLQPTSRNATSSCSAAFDQYTGMGKGGVSWLPVKDEWCSAFVSYMVPVRAAREDGNEYRGTIH